MKTVKVQFAHDYLAPLIFQNVIEITIGGLISTIETAEKIISISMINVLFISEDKTSNGINQ
jgi:hypothetical protein